LVNKNRVILIVTILALIFIFIFISQRITLNSASFKVISNYVHNNEELINKIGVVKKIVPNNTLEFFGSTTEEPYIRYKVRIYGERADAYVTIKVVRFDKKTNNYKNIVFEDIEIYPN